MNSIHSSKYEADFVEWIEQQVTLLHEKRLDLIDVDHIAEELISMGKDHHRELESRLEILMMHLLRCQFQPDQKSASWLGTIREQRTRIHRLLRQSPSLGPLVGKYALDAYADAVARAVIDTGLTTGTFPRACPYQSSELLDVEFIP